MVKVKGRLRVQLIREDGSEEVFEYDNLITNIGKNHIAYRVSNLNAVGPQNYLAVGTGITAPAAGDAGLAAEIARITAAVVIVSGPVWQIAGTFPPGVGTGTLGEAGVFDTGNPLASTMMSRVTFVPTIVKAAGDALNFSWKVGIL